MLRFAGKIYRYVAMASKPVGRYPGYVLLSDDSTGRVFRARADCVTIIVL